MNNILLLATNNPGKLVEIQDLLLGLPVQLVLPRQMGLALDVVEDGQTYAENAALKALAFSKASGLVALADDSGLEVDALEGRPGLYSARFSPLPGATDADRRVYLLEQLQGKPRPWQAHFHCTVAIAVDRECCLSFPGGHLVDLNRPPIRARHPFPVSREDA